MANFHFVEDYKKLVDDLLRRYPVDEAMSLAVGGGWEEVGGRCAQSLLNNGLADGMNVLDFGCGSGRVAHAISKRVKLNEFIGIDIVESLLQYASSKCPNYKFIMSQSYKIPVLDERVDMAYAFSVFTHLLQTEIYIYTREVHKKLKKGGLFIYSYLDMDKHWNIFRDSADGNLVHGRPYPHLNMFLDKNQIIAMSEKSGFEVRSFIDPDDPVSGIGQSIVVLKKI